MEPLSTDLYSPNRPQIAKVRYTHDAMIDVLIQNPALSQNELALHFGYSVPWVCNILSSDAFQARFAARREELVDPTIRATVEERFKALVIRSLDVIQQKLDRPVSAIDDKLAIDALATASKALGYGARVPHINAGVVNIIQVPAQANNAADWASAHAPKTVESEAGFKPRGAQVVDAEIVE